MALSLACYKLAAGFPANERFELASQLRRAASSVPLNIAEGYGYGTRRVFVKHLRMARGSLAEVGTILDLAVALGQTPEREDIREQVDRTARIVHGLIRSLLKSSNPDPGTR